MISVTRSYAPVRIYDISAGIEHKSTLSASGRVSRLRFVNGRLWVLSKRGDRVAVFDLTQPDPGVAVGEITQDAARYFYTRYCGGPQKLDSLT